jgi:uncharacterized protein (DUF2147 family)
MSMRKSLIAVAVIGVMAWGSPLAHAAPEGVWLRPSTGGKVQSFTCRGGLGLKVVGSKTKRFIGQTIMCGAGQTGPNSYRGSLRHLEQGQTYTGKVEFFGRIMRLSGCIMNGLICQTEEWRRLK